MSTPSGSAIRVRTCDAIAGTAGAPHDLVEQGAVGDGMVGHRRPRRPQRRGIGQRPGDGRAPVQVETGQSRPERRIRQAGGVGRDHRNRHIGLAAPRELRPVRRHPLLRVDQPTLDQHRQHRRGDALAARGNHHQRVRRHRPTEQDVRPRPEIDNLHTPVDNRHGGAILTRVGKIPAEGIGHRTKALCNPTPDCQHRTSISAQRTSIDPTMPRPRPGQ